MADFKDFPNDEEVFGKAKQVVEEADDTVPIADKEDVSDIQDNIDDVKEISKQFLDKDEERRRNEKNERLLEAAKSERIQNKQMALLEELRAKLERLENKQEYIDNYQREELLPTIEDIKERVEPGMLSKMFKFAATTALLNRLGVYDKIQNILLETIGLGKNNVDKDGNPVQKVGMGRGLAKAGLMATKLAGTGLKWGSRIARATIKPMAWMVGKKSLEGSFFGMADDILSAGTNFGKGLENYSKNKLEAYKEEDKGKKGFLRRIAGAAFGGSWKDGWSNLAHGGTDNGITNMARTIRENTTGRLKAMSERVADGSFGDVKQDASEILNDAIDKAKKVKQELSDSDFGKKAREQFDKVAGFFNHNTTEYFTKAKETLDYMKDEITKHLDNIGIGTTFDEAKAKIDEQVKKYSTGSVSTGSSTTEDTLSEATEAIQEATTKIQEAIKQTSKPQTATKTINTDLYETAESQRKAEADRKEQNDRYEADKETQQDQLEALDKINKKIDKLTKKVGEIDTDGGLMDDLADAASILDYADGKGNRRSRRGGGRGGNGARGGRLSRLTNWARGTRIGRGIGAVARGAGGLLRGAGTALATGGAALRAVPVLGQVAAVGMTLGQAAHAIYDPKEYGQDESLWGRTKAAGWGLARGTAKLLDTPTALASGALGLLGFDKAAKAVGNLSIDNMLEKQEQEMKNNRDTIAKEKEKQRLVSKRQQTLDIIKKNDDELEAFRKASKGATKEGIGEILDSFTRRFEQEGKISETDKDESLWQSVKSFFGIGSDEKKDETPTTTPSSSSTPSTTTSVGTSNDLANVKKEQEKQKTQKDKDYSSTIGEALYDFNKTNSSLTYGFGSKGTNGTKIDCSGFTAAASMSLSDKILIDGKELTDEQKKKMKNLVGTSAAEQLRNVGKEAGIRVQGLGSELSESDFQEGDIIGEDNGDKGWDAGRYNGIDHITQVVRGPDGKLFVSESTARKDANGKTGVQLTSLGAYLKRKQKTKLYVSSLPKALEKTLGGAISMKTNTIETDISKQVAQAVTTDTKNTTEVAKPKSDVKAPTKADNNTTETITKKDLQAMQEDTFKTLAAMNNDKQGAADFGESTYSSSKKIEDLQRYYLATGLITG